MQPLVAPSLLSANFGNLDADIEMINNSRADWFHIDVMDGIFVPNITFGFPVMKAIKKKAIKPLDVHLMIVDPEKYLEKFKSAGASILTVHYETVNHLHSVVMKIKSLEMKAGVSINPHTPVSLLEEIIPFVDMVLLMTVNPGFGGQSFIESSYNKIKKLKELIQKTRSKSLIQVDGGVDQTNAPLLVKAGVNVLVAGSTVFGSEDPEMAIDQLKQSHKSIA